MTKNKPIYPPKWALNLFRWFCNPDYCEDIEGDLIERFERRLNTRGPGRAKWLFVLEVIRLFRPGIIRNFEGNRRLNYYGMFKNYLFIALRNMKKEKLFTFMNVAGLSLGIGCALVIYSVITHELSFDKHHSKYDNIYRVISKFENRDDVIYGAGQIHPIARSLRDEFPGVNAAVTYYHSNGLVSIKNQDETYDKFLEQDGIVFTNSNLFEILDFKFLGGDKSTCLDEQKSAVVSSSLAQKYFSLEQKEVNKAVGRSIILENTETLVITGVVSDPPKNTDFPFHLLINYNSIPVVYEFFDENDWDDFSGMRNCYVHLPPSVSKQEMDDMLIPFTNKYRKNAVVADLKFFLQPLAEMHTSELTRTYSKYAPITKNMLLAISLVGIFLILTAAINFVNMSTAQASKRAKEVGVRKALGGERSHLTIQFLGETFLITLFSAAVGVFMAEFIASHLNRILSYDLSVNIFQNAELIWFLAIATFSIAITSGIYPALIMARMDPVNALKNKWATGGSGFLSLRRILVIIQFTISQVLIIGTLVVVSQTDYFLSKDLGISKESILISKLPKFKYHDLDLLKNNLTKHANIEKVSYSYRPPHDNWAINNAIGYHTLEENEHFGNMKPADEDFMDLYQLELIAGRNYSAVDSTNYGIINRFLANTMGFEHPQEAIGQSFDYSDWIKIKVIGVVEDFHSKSLHQSMENVVFANLDRAYETVSIKFNTGESFDEIQNVINTVDAEWAKIFPNDVFDCEFYDEKIEAMYEKEKITAQLFNFFSVIAIVIGCLGLYGLVSFMANQKTKEIGVRKVLGASIWNILKIFSAEMLLLVGLAFLISGPVGYAVMSSWLEEFSYRISISPLIFIVAISISVLIAILTISHSSVKASLANPVNSLKDE